MIPFHSRAPCRQYIKNKLNPVGVKLFARSGRSSMVYNFEFYQGKNTVISAEYKEFGVLKTNRMEGAVLMSKSQI